MKCEKCGDRGFIEREHGLIMVLCDCDKGNELRVEITGVVDDSNSGTERDNRVAGSGDTGKPKQSQKPKAKKKARARTG